jgi:hypothetical protein
MDRGWVKLWRKAFDSGIHRNHKLWALWTWILGNVTHKEYSYIVGSQKITLKPGQMITGRKVLAEELAMSPQNIRTCLLLLKKFGNLTIKSTNKYSLLTVINWELYQSENSKPTSKSTSIQPATNQQLTTKQEHKNIRNNPSDIFSMKKRYANPDLIDDAFRAIASTRKSGKVAGSVLLAQLQQWERYPVEQVEAGIRVYLDKDYAGQGKREDYLYGIIRKLNSQPKTNRGGQDRDSGPPEPVYKPWERGNF